MANKDVSLVQISPEDATDVIQQVVDEFSAHLQAHRGVSLDDARSQAQRECEKELAETARTGRGGFFEVRTRPAHRVGSLWVTVRDRPEPATWHLLYIAIDPQWRGQGFGRAALCALMDMASIAGATAITLHVSPTNKVAQSLYKSLGFQSFNHGLIFHLR